MAGGSAGTAGTGGAACVLPSAPAVIDCTAGACDAIAVPGDPIPSQGFRGYADPSLRKDPGGPRIWLGYSFPRPVQTVDAAGKPTVVTLVETHLASSNDGGQSFAFTGTLFPNVGPMNDPGGSGAVGYLNSETVSLAPAVINGVTTWFSSRLVYFTKAQSTGGGPIIGSFTVRIAHADTPEKLGAAKEQVLGLTSFLPAAYGGVADLNTIAGQACTYWNDPGLFFDQGKLHLVIECVGQSQIRLFTAVANDDVSLLEWKDRGALSDAATATELGDEELDQADLVRAKDGALLLLATPSHTNPGTISSHAGCRAIEVESLDPPKLRRDCDGKLVVRASITASDLSSTGSCGYDPASMTGIVLARRPEGGLAGSLVRSHLP